jgi:hypothetical protein
MSEIIRQRSAALQKFTGGLNNYWDQSAIADNELASIVNFEFSPNGALMSRPPIYREMSGETPIVSPVVGQPIDIIGTYIRADGARFLVATTNAKTWIYNITAKSWTEIASFKASDCTQYLNKIVLCSTTVAGGYWENGTFTSTPSMPLLGGIELFQTRFFGYGVEGSSTANIVYWSNISTAGPSGESTSVWNWRDSNNNYLYVEIGGGDGQWITAIAQGYNDIVIFRNKSTYRYSYGDVPEEGNMQVMQQDIGAESKRSVVKFENAHFVLSGGILYKYQNWLYYPLNAQKVKLEEKVGVDRRFQHAVSIVGRRAIVWHNGGVYAYNLDTETWSEWDSTSNVAYFVTVPRSSEENAEELYFGISGATTALVSGVSEFSLFRIEDAPVSKVGLETFKCSLRTKIYDFETPVEWKRLYFWSADVASALPVTAVVYPVAITEASATTSWDELSKDGPTDVIFKTWDELSKDFPLDAFLGTWDEIAIPTGAIGTTVSDFPHVRPLRIEMKLNQALRFRRIYFELYLDCDGTALTSPVQVFSIIPMVGAKAKIAKGAN